MVFGVVPFLPLSFLIAKRGSSEYSDFSFSLCVSFGFSGFLPFLLPPSIWLYAEPLKTAVMILDAYGYY